MEAATLEGTFEERAIRSAEIHADLLERMAIAQQVYSDPSPPSGNTGLPGGWQEDRFNELGNDEEGNEPPSPGDSGSGGSGTGGSGTGGSGSSGGYGGTSGGWSSATDGTYSTSEQASYAGSGYTVDGTAMSTDGVAANDANDPRVQPIVLDLDGDGVEVSISPYASFDFDGDGYLEQAGSWASSDDGFLVLDLNADGTRGAGDGIIDQAEELVLSLWGQAGDTDLQALGRAFDDNDDGVLDAADAVWDELKVWQDLDQDGVTDAGGAGDDKIEGGAADDILSGDAGADTLRGGEGDDIVFFDAADAVVQGQGGRDIAIATEAHSYDAQGALVSAAANVTLNLQAAGFESAQGGDGHDHFLVTATHGAAISVSAGLGNDTVTGGGEDDVLSGDAGNDTLTGRDGDDVLTGGDGRDTLMGDAGDDLLLGGDGNDSLDGGAGDDRAFGGAGDDAVQGDDGDDLLAGGDGDDTIDGGLGDDVIQGDDGNDHLIGSSGDDLLSGGDGNDTLSGGEGTDYLEGGVGEDLLDGGAGILDTVAYTSSDAGVTINLGTGTATGGHATGDTLLNVEAVIGSGHAETLTGDDQANILWGGAGSDVLDSQGGNDRVYGGFGADSISGGDGHDVLIGDDEVGAHATGGLFYEYRTTSTAANGHIGTFAQLASAATEGIGYTYNLDVVAIDASHGGTGDYFGLKMYGVLEIESGGTYSFDLQSDDGLRIMIDEVAVYARQGGGSGAFSVDLAPGQHEITIEYFELHATEALRIDVQGPDTDDAVLALTESGLLGAPNDHPYVADQYDDGLSGGDGNDQLLGRQGDDTLEGGAGRSARPMVLFRAALAARATESRRCITARSEPLAAFA